MHDICEGLTEAKFDSNLWASNVEAKDHFDLRMDGLIELFQLTTLKNRHEPLTPKILQDTNHHITRAILKAYTSEKLGLYRELNAILRNEIDIDDQKLVE